MKTLNMKYNIAILLLLLSANCLFGQAFSESNTIGKAFKLNSNMTIDITNKYGKVHIIESQEDSIKIFVDYTIQSTNEAKFIKMRNSLNIDFTSTQYYITAITTIGSPKNNIVKEIIDMADPKYATDNLIIIDYTVYAPNTVNLEIENKYGDVYIDNQKGSFKLELSNGKLKANEFSGKTNISIKFGDATINKLSNARLNIDYSDLYIKKGGNLNIICKSSNINIDEVKSLKIDSRRDKFHIDKIETFNGKSSFSDFWIYSLSNEINSDLNYGDFNVDLIYSSFSFIKINSKYTDLALIFEKGSAYNLDMIQKSLLFSYPESISNLNMKPDMTDEKRFFINGTIGNKTTNSPNVSINAEKGSLDITHK